MYRAHHSEGGISVQQRTWPDKKAPGQGEQLGEVPWGWRRNSRPKAGKNIDSWARGEEGCPVEGRGEPWAGLAGGQRPGDEGKKMWSSQRGLPWGLAYGVENGGVMR